MSNSLQPGIDNLAKLNITTGLQLEEYVCEGLVNGALDEDGNWHEYVPFCKWPYIFAGWGDSGLPGNNDTDVLSGACTITHAESYKGSYMARRAVYFSVNLIATCMAIRNLFIFKQKRLASKSKAVTTSESLSRLNVTICIAHFIILLDPDGTDFMNYMALSLFQGYNGAAMVSLAFLLINSWVTIVDGGKSKKTPPWMDKLTKFSIFFVIFCEVVLAVIEILVVPDDDASYDGSLNAVKGFLFALLCILWAGICLKYYLKIRAQLKAGAASSGSKAIKKYCIALLFGMLLGFLYKVAFSLIRVGSTVHGYPYCGGAGMVSIINIMFLIIQFACLFAQNPKNQTKKVSPSGATTVTTTSSE